MSTTLTPLGVSVLALLNERPMHPYEMCQLLRERHEDRLVKVRPGSLYHTVERLADHELVAPLGTAREGNRPERTTYTITASGRAALVGRVAEILREPVNEFPRFPVALAESHNLPREEFLDLLAERESRLCDRIEEVTTLIGKAQDRQVPEAYWFAADYVRAQWSAEREWITTVAKRVRDGELSWPRTP